MHKEITAQAEQKKDEREKVLKEIRQAGGKSMPARSRKLEKRVASRKSIKTNDGTFLIYALAPEVYLVLISHDINGL